MKKTKFSESQIVAILQEGEAGLPVAQILRKYGISQATYYNWKVEVRRRLSGRAQAPEGTRGRERQAQAHVCRPSPGERSDQGRSGSKALTPSATREAIRIMTEEHGVSVKRACQAARLSRAAYYRPETDRGARDREVIEALNEIDPQAAAVGLVGLHARHALQRPHVPNAQRFSLIWQYTLCTRL